MADLSYNQLRAKIDIRTGDGGNIAFTDQEKDEFMNAAFQDGYVYIIGRDDTTLTIASTAAYPVPGGVDKVTQILYDVLGDGYGVPLDRSTWRQIDGNIYFSYLQKGLLAGKTLIMTGRRKITTSDTVPDELQEYILNLALVNAYQYVLAKLTTRFVKNDITTSECLAAIGRHQGQANSLRAQFVATESSGI